MDRSRMFRGREEHRAWRFKYQILHRVNMRTRSGSFRPELSVHLETCKATFRFYKPESATAVTRNRSFLTSPLPPPWPAFRSPTPTPGKRTRFAGRGMRRAAPFREGWIRERPRRAGRWVPCWRTVPQSCLLTARTNRDSRPCPGCCRYRASLRRYWLAVRWN